MSITTVSSREFNQHASDAKRSANKGPVFITDRGRPAHVLLCIEDYQKLAGAQMTLVDALAQRSAPAFDFDPPRAEGLYHPADLS